MIKKICSKGNQLQLAYHLKTDDQVSSPLLKYFTRALAEKRKMSKFWKGIILKKKKKNIQNSFKS